MNFHEALSEYADDELLDTIASLYPDADREGYAQALRELRSIEPRESDFIISLVEIPIGEFNDEPYIDVGGIVDGENYAIEFRPWADWLGSEIAPASIKKIGLLKCMAHMLWEMTFCGYSDAEVAADWAVIEQRSKEIDEAIENGTLEDITVPWPFEDKE